MICEDVWHQDPVENAKKQGAELIIVINASPFDTEKESARENVLKNRAQENNIPIIYLNTIGGQDELVFDGGSFAVSAQGEIVSQAC